MVRDYSSTHVVANRDFPIRYYSLNIDMTTHLPRLNHKVLEFNKAFLAQSGLEKQNRLDKFPAPYNPTHKQIL